MKGAGLKLKAIVRAVNMNYVQHMKILTLLIIGQIFFTIDASAEPLIVGFDRSYEQRTIELNEEQTGEVTVYLKSDGWPLDGYKVGLVRHSDNRVMNAKTTDESGIIIFPDVVADRYRIKILFVPKAQRQDYIEIGDVTVAVSPKKKEVDPS